MIALRKRQLGMAHLSEDEPTEERLTVVYAPDLLEPGLGVVEPPLGDRAEYEERLKLNLIVASAQPAHYVQGGAGVLDRGAAVAKLHGQLGDLGAEHGWLPGSVVFVQQRQRALGGLERAGGISGVLAYLAQPVEGGRGGAGIGVASEPLQPVGEAVGVGRVIGEHHPGVGGQVRVAPGPGAELTQEAPDRSRPFIADDHRVGQEHCHRAPGQVLELGWRTPAADQVGDRVDQDDQTGVLAPQRPERPKSGEQLDERVRIALGDRTP